MSLFEGRRESIGKRWNDKLWHVIIFENSIIKTGVPLLSVLISILAVSYAQQANLIAESQASPQFEVALMGRNPDTASSSVDLVVSSKNSVCPGFQVETKTFVLFLQGMNSSTKNYLLPFEDYFSTHKIEGCNAKFSGYYEGTNHDGSKYFFGHYNSAELHRLIFKLHDASSLQGTSTTLIPTPFTFSKIQYQDGLGRVKFDYRENSINFNGKITKEQWDNLSLIYEKRRHINFSSEPSDIVAYFVSDPIIPN